VQLSEEQARRRFAEARHAYLATSDPAGQPHLVPVTFAVRDDVVVIAVDHKPKSGTRLKRLRNIEANDQVSLLVDEYHEDWTRLWWARADGVAELCTDDVAEPVRWLSEKYPPYREQPPAGPVVYIEVRRWSGWSYTG
jgi:PPOX class probable F420-dependent enzyme